MFQEKLKELRVAKGFTQEELALRLNVVRQTISKWEKGLSVPDAELLVRLAEELEVPVSCFLGGAEGRTPEKNEIAAQLSRLNEQLAVKNRRWRRVGKILLICLAAAVVALALSYSA